MHLTLYRARLPKAQSASLWIPLDVHCPSASAIANGLILVALGDEQRCSFFFAYNTFLLVFGIKPIFLSENI